MADHVDVSDLAAGMNNSILQLVLRVLTTRGVDRFPDFGLIFRNDALNKRFVAWLSTERIKTQHAVAFFGEIFDLARGRTGGETARVAEPLRLGQITLAAPHCFFRLFQVMNIRIAAVPSLDVSRTVHQRIAATQEPTIFAIVPSEA